MPGPQIQELVDFFHDPKTLESPKYKAFVTQRLKEKDVLEVYGVGDAAAEKLAKKGITKAWQLLGYVLNTNKEDTLEFLKKHGVASAFVKPAAFTLVQYYKKYNCD